MVLEFKNQDLEIVIANTFFKRLKGLILISPVTFGMYFPKCNSIHTFFMKENIDVIGLNEQNEVIFIRRNVSKNQMIRIKHPYHKTNILELPANSSDFIKMGSILFFKDEDII